MTFVNVRIVKVGRDARTGKFIPVRVAQRNPRTTVVETYTFRPRRAPVRKRYLKPGPPTP